MMQSKRTKTEAFVKKESFTEKEFKDMVDELLDRHFKVYDRLAEI